jgi:hypothetical protein
VLLNALGSSFSISYTLFFIIIIIIFLSYDN